MDPITSGTRIFKQIADDFGRKSITSPNEIDSFFTDVMKLTNGWVIVDFLDAACWDKIHAYEIDKQSRLLTLTWHDYRNIISDEGEKEMRRGSG
jgi:hypothetical protein